MRSSLGVALTAALAIAGCSSKKAAAPDAAGHVVIVLTIDWEGAYISPEGLEAMGVVRKAFGTAPLTHFISAAYYTKPEVDPGLQDAIKGAVLPQDEVGVHIHAWKSLALAAGVTPKLSPSFLSGTDKLLEFEDDIGFDVDLDAYSVPELRSLLQTSRKLLSQTGLPITRSFRAGGYLGTPKVLAALQDEGFAVDSSATDYRQIADDRDDALAKRIQAIWPKVDATSQPFSVSTPHGPVLEMPIAAFTDYSTSDEIAGIIDGAYDRLQKDKTHDQFVLLGFHQETAADFGPRLTEALQKVQKRPEVAARLSYMTVEQAAAKARQSLDKH